jgi:hypothetical protein
MFFFSFFSSDDNNSYLFSFFAVTTTLIFSWYYKETITNFWKSWWNKNKENLNTNMNNSNNSNASTTVPSNMPKEAQGESNAIVVPTITQDEVSAAAPTVPSNMPKEAQSESKVIVVPTVTQDEVGAAPIVPSNMPKEAQGESKVIIVPTITQDEVSAAPSDNILESISKKWYNYPLDKIQVVSITNEDRMIFKGNLEFNNTGGTTAVAKIVNTLYKNITNIIIKKNKKYFDIDNAYDLQNNKQIIAMKKNYCTSTNKNYANIRSINEDFIKLNQNKQIGLVVKLDEPLIIIENNEPKEYTLIELDPILNYEEIIDMTIAHSERFINITKIGLYDQLLSKSMILLFYNSYFYLTDLKIEIDSKEYINILHISFSALKQNDLSTIAASKRIAICKTNCNLHDYLFKKGDEFNAYITEYETYEKCEQYYFSNYYSNIDLFFSQNQQKNLFKRLITEDYLNKINVNEVSCLDFLLSEIDKHSSQKDNVLFVTKTEVIPQHCPKFSSKIITDTILTDLYKLNPNDTEKTSLEKVKEIVSAEDYKKICDINTTFESTIYISYSDHIDKVNEFLSLLI